MPVDLPQTGDPTRGGVEGATREQLSVYGAMAVATCLFWALAIYGLMRLVNG